MIENGDMPESKHGQHRLASSPQEVLIHPFLGALKWGISPKNGPFCMVNTSDEPLEYEVMLGNRKPSPKFQCVI
jgi:hypothetical protein